MPTAYINAIGKFLPGDAIPNDQLEEHLGLIKDRSSKARKCVLKRNGIQQRHYAIDNQQRTRYSNSQMAAQAVRDGLDNAGIDAQAIDLLSCGTTLPDLLVPGFASMVHGELPELSPLEIVSTQGVCCSGVSALNYAVSQLELGKRHNAISVASEFASRLFKHTKFEAETAVQNGESLPFDTEFLRWMLSDGAGAFVLQDRPNPKGLSLRVDWIELISHANAYPVCMSAGSVDGQTSWLDYPTYIDAAEAGAMNLRQNTRLLDQVVKLGVEGWLKLIETGRVKPDEIDWLLCHYSSHFFKSKIVDLLEKAECMIPEHKWFTNLYTRGNTGCASIYLMLEELFHSNKLHPDQRIFCFVPESGRFTTAYMMLTVVDASTQTSYKEKHPAKSLARKVHSEIATPHPFGTETQPQLPKTHAETSHSANVLRQLTLVWLEFERQLRSVPLVRRLHQGTFTLQDYQALLCNLRPQVAEGARWIARAASNFSDFQLRSTFIKHAQEEHRDFQMLELNYGAVGGDPNEILKAEKNIGGEALSAFIFQQASQPNPVDLIGSMMIIEGVGNQLAGQWAQKIQLTLNLSADQVSFLAYHGDNDASHLEKLEALLQADWMTDEIGQRIIKTAQVTARLYRLQLEEIQ